MCIRDRSIEALGTQVNSVRMQFLVPRAKRKTLLRKCFDTLRLNLQHKLTARKYASLIGTLNAVRGAVTSAPLHIWPLLHLQKTVLAKLQSWDQQVHLTPRVIQELEWWQTELKDWNGKSVIPQKHQHILTTDASHLGWGGGGGTRWVPDTGSQTRLEGSSLTERARTAAIGES